MTTVDSTSAILREIGGVENIVSLSHCMTRLRFVLKKDDTIDDERIKNISGVMGISRRGGQYQVIVGTDVSRFYTYLMKLIAVNDNISPSVELKEEQSSSSKSFSIKKIGNSILDVITGTMSSLLPVLIGGGMIKILLQVLELFNVSTEYPTIKLLGIISDAAFYFMPIMVAYSAAVKMKCSPMLSVVIVSILIHPDLIAMFTRGNSSFLTVPVVASHYASSVIPAFLIVYFLSLIQPITDKYISGWAKTIFKPMLILLICVPVSLVLLAPLGNIIGSGIASIIISATQGSFSWLTLGIFSAILPFLIVTGMHWAMVPYMISSMGTTGHESIVLPCMLAVNIGFSAASAAVAWKTKNTNLKAISISGFITAAISGITEPVIYGVALKLRKPFIATMIGSGITGVFIGVVSLKAYSFSVPSLVAILMFMKSSEYTNLIYAVIAVIMSFILCFIMTLILGWDDPED
ncbi:PTS system beta-glucosides-specific IIC component|uniref:PTS system beta-glucoside-specific IIB component (Glc family) /PTS system beta-glucoside-specific IIC component (Glc family) n=1 Tax=Brenneria salicis ATCC 15712 = DSM 30166 TaxID=714314 RepID=A0A366I666_9GAMM|nr:PTS transporter subunit EIIC [Brenneria salicis]NMN91909.1 PTS system beta-glucosides-specific IIC component [Brenneria salicis ATCC 15712 = DSM 30166]RBP62871.1 PTS system beta-glucoside-specific IIB component (Glc family) /PTS system beta-glucoside-specific IIC component (Glc family) [Brenneria salicis ATCC 15712 = DSM 30166]